MLEQIWKNIAGGEFPALAADMGVQVLIKRGCQYRICDFIKLLARVEEALDKKLRVTATYVGEGEMLLNIFIDEQEQQTASKKSVTKKRVETSQEVPQEE